MIRIPLMLRRAVVLTSMLALCGSICAENATVITADHNNRASRKTYALQRVGPEVLRLTVPLNDIRSDAKYMDIQADFATAKKGDDGYWVFPRGVYGTFRLEKGAYADYAMIPVYGMKTPTRTFVAIVNGMNYEYKLRLEITNGIYTLSQRYLIDEIGCAPYEDITVDFHMLAGDDANYSGMARTYRKYQLERGAVHSIKDRIASGNAPCLASLCDALPVRMAHAGKSYKDTQNTDYTAATELPVNTYLTFDGAKEVVSKIKEAGIDKLAICVAGWQTGGYDGRRPQTFPVTEGAGGEAKLREYIRFAQSLGFVIDGHSNFTDAFAVSPMWNTNLVCKKSDGSLAVNGFWSGGKAYNLCPRNAWETFYPSDIRKIGALGFRGAHYIDVFSATRPYACTDPAHPCNRKEAGNYQKKMLHAAREIFGGAASECGWDHVAGELDYINYTARHMLTFYAKNKKPEPVDGVVPFWEIVYHGIILSNPDKITQNKLDAVNALRLVEFGGRPIFYSATLRNIPDLKAAYDAFKPLRHLQKEFMQSHEFLAKDVARIVYSDGSEIVCNYTGKDFVYKGKSVKPVSYELYRIEGKGRER